MRLCFICAVLCLVTPSCPTLCGTMDCSSSGSSVSGGSPSKNTGVGCHALLQGIFPTHGLNPGLLPCRQILYGLSHQERSRILEWVAYPFSRDLPHPEIELGSPALQVDSLPAEVPGKALLDTGNWNTQHIIQICIRKTDLNTKQVKRVRKAEPDIFALDTHWI